MGGGKTAVGALLAERLGRRFVDLDRVIEDSAGASIAAQFEAAGEGVFRSREADELTIVLAGTDPLVLATGGGVVLLASNCALLRDRAQIVWLRARPETLASRVRDGAGRPLLTDSREDPLTVLRRLDIDRAPLYAEIADVVVDVDELTPAGVVDRIVEQL